MESPFLFSHLRWIAEVVRSNLIYRVFSLMIS